MPWVSLERNFWMVFFGITLCGINMNSRELIVGFILNFFINVSKIYLGQRDITNMACTIASGHFVLDIPHWHNNKHVLSAVEYGIHRYLEFSVECLGRPSAPSLKGSWFELNPFTSVKGAYSDTYMELFRNPEYCIFCLLSSVGKCQTGSTL